MLTHNMICYRLVANRVLKAAGIKKTFPEKETPTVNMIESDTNQRKFERFSAKSGTIVAIRPIPELLGEMIDIGFGGLSFRYIQAETTPQESAELIILLPNRTFFLDKIPCKPVSDIPLYSENSFSSLPMRRCSIAFGPLIPSQQTQLEHFILNYTVPRYHTSSMPLNHLHLVQSRS